MADPFAEISAYRNAAQENQRQNQIQPVQIQHMMQQQALARDANQRAAQEQQINMQSMQRQQQLQDAQRQRDAEGAGAFANYFKNRPQQEATAPLKPMQGPMPNGQTMQDAGIGPSVSAVQASQRPQMQQMTLESVAQSIYKNNPNISPEGFVAAIDRFTPLLNQQDKMQVEQIKAQHAASGTNAEREIQSIMDNMGVSYENADTIYRARKRAAPEEIGLAATAKQKGQGKISETEQMVRGEKQIGDIVDELSGLYDTAAQQGGAVNPENSIGANLSARAQTSGLGQFIGGAIGTKLQTTLDKIEQSRPLLISAIRKATGMGAKAMDSNTELQFYLSAATDPTRGLPANKDALERLVRFSNGDVDAIKGGGGTPASTKAIDFNTWK